MSIQPTAPHPYPPERATNDAAVITDLLALASNCNHGLDREDSVDYWFRLGQRNAHAQAVGLLLSQRLRQDPTTIAERITTALDAGASTAAELSSAAYGESVKPATAELRLEWMGPKAFDKLDIAGLDHDFGMRWGPRGDQRISLRLHENSSIGVLYAYDPTWDEYAVLSRGASRAAVEAAFADAVCIDVHLDPARFTELVLEHEATRDTSRAVVVEL
ncbi:hypothetical protein N864_16415 [Intrasporangium chromatireducens Q5-1]|uniref:Uncharacterized protein n=1 Tax=Intrasporangium chromatireducens Q5-1 TaxID=584657 RepID=W9GSF8_9MICO|nr:hypothetical protein [Intrasporangium chromatireducens]EWT06834.1 hypothetical protein N864_16415 [Intrasporangium chromatireducens Q5-1]